MTAFRAARLVVGTVVLLSTARVAAMEVQERDTHALALECRGALWKQAFDDAKAAGLNPGAIAIDFTASKAERRDAGGEVILTGIEDYRPTTDVAPFPVRYECRLDAATGTVRAVTYTAVDEAGLPIATAPTQMVKDRRQLAACLDHVSRRLEDDVRKRGIDGPVASVEVMPRDVEWMASGNLAELRGRGRGRYDKAFDWQILNFSCRYDLKRQRVARTTYALETPLPALALPRESLEAIDACRLAVGSEVLADAVQRGYRRLERVEIELPELANVTPRGSVVDVAGRGQFRLDVRHRQPTPLTFACTWDPAARRVVSASFEVAAGSWTPSGEIANGPTGSLRCGSPRLARQECRAEIRGNVRVIREFGTTRCEAYRNWMWSASQIVVWDGCAAEFEYDAR